MKTAFPPNCKHCQSQNLEVRQGSGPHAGAIHCTDCGRWQKWLSKSDATRAGLEVNRG